MKRFIFCAVTIGIFSCSESISAAPFGRYDASGHVEAKVSVQQFESRISEDTDCIVLFHHSGKFEIRTPDEWEGLGVGSFDVRGKKIVLNVDPHDIRLNNFIFQHLLRPFLENGVLLSAWRLKNPTAVVITDQFSDSIHGTLRVQGVVLCESGIQCGSIDMILDFAATFDTPIFE